MANITKTQGQTLLALQSIATANSIVGTALDVSTKLAATVFVRFGRHVANVLTAGWPNIRIEGSAKSSGTDAWVPLAIFQPSPGVATIGATTLNGTVTAADPSIVVASASNFAVGGLIFIEDSTFANGEWARIKSIVSTTLTLEEPVTNGHANGSVVTAQAEVFVAQLDLTAIGRIRVVADNLGSGYTIGVEAQLVTADSLT